MPSGKICAPHGEKIPAVRARAGVFDFFSSAFYLFCFLGDKIEKRKGKTIMHHCVNGADLICRAKGDLLLLFMY